MCAAHTPPIAGCVTKIAGRGSVLLRRRDWCTRGRMCFSELSSMPSASCRWSTRGACCACWCLTGRAGGKRFRPTYALFLSNKPLLRHRCSDLTCARCGLVNRLVTPLCFLPLVLWLVTSACAVAGVVQRGAGGEQVRHMYPFRS